MLYAIIATLFTIFIYFISPLSTASLAFQRRRISDLGGQIGPGAHCILGWVNILLLTAGASLSHKISGGSLWPHLSNTGLNGFDDLKYALQHAYSNYRIFTQVLDTHLFQSWLSPLAAALPQLGSNAVVSSALGSFVQFWLNADFAIKMLVAYPFITAMMIGLQAITTAFALPIKKIITRFNSEREAASALNSFIISGWTFGVFPLMISAFMTEVFVFMHLAPLVLLMIIPSVLALVMGTLHPALITAAAFALVALAAIRSKSRRSQTKHPSPN